MKYSLHHLLDALVAAPLRYPRRVLVFVIASLAVAGFGLATMELDADIEELVGTPSALAYGRLADVFGWRERAYILLETEDSQQADALVRCARRMSAELVVDPAVSSVVFGAPDATSIGDLLFPYGLMLLDDPEGVEGLLREPDLFDRAAAAADLLSLPGLGDSDRFVAEDPFGFTKPLAARFDTLRGGYRFAPGSPFFVSEDGRALLVVVQGSGGNASSMARLADTVDAAVAAALAPAALPAGDPRIAVTLTGGVYLAAESHATIQADLIRSLSMSIGLAIVLLALGLRIGVLVACALCLPTLWGSTVGIGAFALASGTVSALSFACAGILIGLGFDFTIHVTAVAILARARGAGPARALLRSFRETRGRLTLAACTSATAFLAFLTSDASFLRDMGVITALGLAACLVSPFVVLPPILLPTLRRSRGTATRMSAMGVMGGLAGLARYPRAVIGCTLVPTLAAGLLLWGEPPRFEDDLRNVHSVGSPALAGLDRLAEVFDGSFEPILLLVDAESERELVEASHALEGALRSLVEDRVLLSVSSIADLVPDAASQAATLAALSAYDPARVAEVAVAALEEAGFEAAEFRDYLDGLMRAVAVDEPVVPSALRDAGFEEIIDRFVGAQERSGVEQPVGLVVLQPREELWAGEARNDLLARVRAAVRRTGLDASVAITGMHPTAAESAEQVALDFGRVSLLTLLAVTCVLWFRFRNLTVVVLTLLPASLGTLWLAALFSLAGFRLNLMNLGVLPMVLALGVDDGIHIVGHYLSDRRRSLRGLLQATGSGILLTSLTTMVTFGSLGLSANRGLASVGVLSFVGIGCCLVASVVVLPTLLERFLDGARSDLDHRGLARGSGAQQIRRDQ